MNIIIYIQLQKVNITLRGFKYFEGLQGKETE